MTHQHPFGLIRFKLMLPAHLRIQDKMIKIRKRISIKKNRNRIIQLVLLLLAFLSNTLRAKLGDRMSDY